MSTSITSFHCLNENHKWKNGILDRSFDVIWCKLGEGVKIHLFHGSWMIQLEFNLSEIVLLLAVPGKIHLSWIFPFVEFLGVQLSLLPPHEYSNSGSRIPVLVSFVGILVVCQEVRTLVVFILYKFYLYGETLSFETFGRKIFIRNISHHCNHDCASL